MDLNKNKLKKRVGVGVLTLGIKRVVVQAIFSISNIFLARLLFPTDFGTFAMVTSVMIFFSVFGDLGLGPSLIQKKDKFSVGDLQTAFSFQLVLGLVIILVIFIAAPFISRFFELGDIGVKLLRIYSLIFLFPPFKTTSGAILERELDYKKLVGVEILEVFATSVSTVFLAILGFGVFSFAYGAISGHIFSAVAYLIAAPWKINYYFSWRNLKKLASFGIPFQSNQVMGLFYGPLVLLYLGKVVGSENLGYFQFAASLSVLPLAFSEIVNRVVFPLGSRFQANVAFFKKITEHSLMMVSLTTLPIVFVGIALAPAVVHFVYTDRWLLALPAIYIGLIQIGIISYSGIATQLLFAKGQAKTMRNMGAFWAVMTWVLAPPLIARFNFVGMNITSLLVSTTGVWLFLKLRKDIKFSYWAQIFPFLVASTIAASATFLLLKILDVSFINFVICLFLGFTAYFFLVAVMVGKILVREVKTLVLTFK